MINKLKQNLKDMKLMDISFQKMMNFFQNMQILIDLK